MHILSGEPEELVVGGDRGQESCCAKLRYSSLSQSKGSLGLVCESFWHLPSWLDHKGRLCVLLHGRQPSRFTAASAYQKRLNRSG